MRYDFLIGSLLAIALIIGISLFFWPPMWWALAFIGPLVLLGLYDMMQKKHAIMRNYPIVGRGRYWMEELRPKMYQYFIESDTNGRPISRIMRSMVYQRAKQVVDTTPFGTQLDVYNEGYEWMNHSIAPKDVHGVSHDPRVLIGGSNCQQPYSASVFNVSAMSYGSLSKNAILALNGGAHIGNFAHNTGEGGISEYHQEPGGDLIYQLGTGYFGSRAADGNFSPEEFQKRAALPQVKMIEVKLSQGAKPGHGGILPAKKNTPEIAAIRGVEPGKDVLSPPFHKAFSTPKGLLEFIQQLRDLSDGKPIGFKLCVGRKSEFIAICKAMVETKIYPDFISVDGGEGGTGAAPIEFSNSIGTPLYEGLAFVHDCLKGFGVRDQIRIIAAGKIISAFDMARAFALGADACYTARAMMLALGCVQALLCNQNNCPTGVATQKPELVAGLVPSDKAQRVASFHKETIEALVELLAASGLSSPSEMSRHLINRRGTMNEHHQYDEIFPDVEPNSMLSIDNCPEKYRKAWKMASAEKF